MQAAVVTFDHLALAFLGCYGSLWQRTPRFDQLAAESVVFDQCYSGGAAAPGLLELADQLRQQGGTVCVQESVAGGRLDDSLRQAIINWCGASPCDPPGLLWLNNRAIRSPWSAPLDRLNDAWRNVFDEDALDAALLACGCDVPDRSSSPEERLAAALPRLTAQGVFDREACSATREFGQLRRVVYAAATSVLDDWLGEVLDLLMADCSQDRLVVVGAGRGDLTGPHSELSAGCPPLIDPLVHVPLLIRIGTAADGSRRRTLATVADVAPTLAEWFGLPPRPDERAARSLWPLLREESDSVRDELLIGSEAIGWCLRTPDFACICGPESLRTVRGDRSEPAGDRAWLFVKPDDAWDTLNVAPQHPDVTAVLLQRIRELRATRSGN